jgi:hypothetical protein
MIRVIAWMRLVVAESLPGTVSTTVMDGADKGNGCRFMLAEQPKKAIAPSQARKVRKKSSVIDLVV